MKAHCLPFSQIPHTTSLFLDFLSYSQNLRSFYPHSPCFTDWFQEEAGKIKYDPSRRKQVADILERQNKSWDASPQTLANLQRLRNGAAAVVTGQQVGLFGGPTFAIYKALTAVKLAEQATAAGVDAVPIFWLATYDHDLAEVNHVSLPGPEGAPRVLTTSSRDVPGAPVAAVRLGEDIGPLLEQAAQLVGDSEIMQFLREAYRPGEFLGTAFARFYARVFAESGVIVLDASDAELARIAAPVFRAAIERAGELSQALMARGQALERAGYHQQVRVTSSSVLLFTAREGARTPMQRRSDGAEFVIGAESTAQKISPTALLESIASTPEQFSPNVLLRPIVQDYLLPTLVYTGGAAEAAYFAQAGAVYELLLGRVTPIVPRFSATLVEPKVQRLLERHGITVPEVFTDPDTLRRELAEKNLPADLQEAFDSARKSLETHFTSVKEKLVKLDRTLVDAAETSRSKIDHQLERLHSQIARAQALKSELVNRHAEMLAHSLYPERELQERGIGGIYFLARYGREFLHLLRDIIHPDCQDHQIIEL